MKLRGIAKPFEIVNPRHSRQAMAVLLSRSWTLPDDLACYLPFPDSVAEKILDTPEGRKIAWMVDEIDGRDDDYDFLARAWRWADLALMLRDDWALEGDEILPRRSAMEFGWAQLTTEEQQKIQDADELWRNNPKALTDNIRGALLGCVPTNSH